MRKYTLITLFSLLVILLAACGGNIESNMPEEKVVPDFEFTNQDEETVTLDDLKGEWWVADLIFTNCNDVCIPMTTNMARLQNELKEKGLDAKLVSFTVDPEYDSPEVLSEYAESYGADLNNWSFLTGYEFETIQEIALKTFMMGVEKDPNSDQVAHGVRFYLINPEGIVIKHYSGLEYDQVDEIVEDLGKVL